MSEPVTGRRVWDVFVGVVSGAVALAVLAQGDPGAVLSATACAGVAGLYYLWGRRFVEGVRPAYAYVAVTLACFAVATWASSAASYQLFAICTVTFTVLPLRTAVPVVVFANLLPVGTAALQPGSGWSYATRYFPIFVMTATVSVGLGLWIHRVVAQSEERGALIAELENSRAEVARLSHEAGVAAERARLAGEIHDTLAQGFTSIITLLQAVDPALSDDRLRLAVSTARENLAESRALVAALTPSALGEGSLTDAVRRQAARLTAEGATTCSVRVTGAARDLPTAAEVVLLRATQEALTNVRRHAAAREATVTLDYADGAVRLVVRDDGRGFDPDGPRGFGLDGMRARAEQVGGVLRVVSSPGAGTTIEVEVPA